MKSLVGAIYRNVVYILPRSIAHKIVYRRFMHKKLNLKNPSDFNEKIQYLMVYKYGEKEGHLADKEKVKKYVSELSIRGLNIPKTLRVYNSANEIDIDDLPNQFVLKCNHGSGNVFVCRDKSSFDLDKAKLVLGRDMKKNYAKNLLEYHYSFIKPVIIAEEYLDDGEHKSPSDYKFHCFNGNADCIMFCTERENGHAKYNGFDLDWNEMNSTTKEYRSLRVFRKPRKLTEMIRIAEQLSKGFPYVRVDLYEVNGKVYFGEYTFSPFGGIAKVYKQQELDRLGKKLDLNLYR